MGKIIQSTVIIPGSDMPPSPGTISSSDTGTATGQGIQSTVVVTH